MKVTQAEIQRRMGAYFAEAREQRRLKQKEVADAIGVTVPTLSRYENGRAPMSASVVRQLSALYQIESDGWTYPDPKQAAMADRVMERRREAPLSESFERADPRYWSARWDQAVSSLRRVLAEHEDLAEEMREQAYRPYRPEPSTSVSGVVTPPVTPERLAQRIADQSPPDVLAGDDSARARG